MYLPRLEISPSSVGIVPVILLFCTCINSNIFNLPINVLIVPTNSLSFKSICLILTKSYNESGNVPPRKLKFKSITSNDVIVPISLGIVPDITPSSNTKNCKFVKCLNSDASVPDKPFLSVHNNKKI